MKCKRLFALLLSLCMIASTFVTVSSADSLTITVGDVEAAAGDTITIPVSLLNNTAGLCGLTLNFTYDADVLAYTDATKGEALPDMALTKPGTSFTEGSIKFLWDSMDPDFTNGEILLITFDVADDAITGDYAIDVIVEDACDFDFNDLETEAVAGSVSVDGLEPTPTPTPDPEIADGNLLNYDLAIDDVSEITWIASNAVTVSNADGIGGRDDVVKVTGLANSNNNTAGVKLPDGFVFEEGDVLAYSVDIYSESEINPDIWLRDHMDLAPFVQFGHELLVPNTWTTVTKTVTYEEMVTLSTGGGSTGAFNTAGNYAMYVRPRQNAGAVYLDNFKIAITREGYEGSVIVPGGSTEEEGTFTVEKWPYVTEEDGTYKVTTADIVANEPEAASSSQVRLRIIPGAPISIEEDLKISFDFEASGILNSQGMPYEVMEVNLRLYDSVGGATQSNTIGYIKNANVAANTGEPVSVTYYIADMVNGGGTSALTDVASIGIQVNMGGAFTGYQNAANDGYFTISNIDVGYGVKEDEPVLPPISPTPTPTPDPDTPSESVTILDIDLPLDSSTELTWVTEDVTVSDADGIGGRDNVVKAEGVGDGNTKTVGVKLGNDFRFQAGDVITYSVDVYSETGLNPDIWLRNHTNLPTFMAFYELPMAANTWNTITKTVTYDELVASGVSGWTDAGEYALYVRPRNGSVIYLDNFKVEVVGNERTEGGDTGDSGETLSTDLTVAGFHNQGSPTGVNGPLNYTLVDDTFAVTFKEIKAFQNENGVNLENNSFVRVTPATPIHKDAKFKVIFDLETSGIASDGGEVSKLNGLVRIFDTVDGFGVANTLGYLRGEVAVNAKEGDSAKAVTISFSSANGLVDPGNAQGTHIKSMGIGLNLKNVYAASADDAYFKISNVRIEYISEIESCEVVGTTTDSVTLNVSFKTAVVEDSIKSACAINGIAWNPELITVVVDENDNKKATVTISGLASSTEYELTLSDTITPTTTKTFATLDAATVTATCSAGTVSYSITNNASGAVDIYAVLLRCKGNTVIESKVISPADGGCASGATLTGTINAGTIGEGEYVKFFAWTYDDGKVNSLAPSQIFE